MKKWPRTIKSMIIGVIPWVIYGVLMLFDVVGEISEEMWLSFPWFLGSVLLTFGGALLINGFLLGHHKNSPELVIFFSLFASGVTVLILTSPEMPSLGFWGVSYFLSLTISLVVFLGK